MGLKTRYYVDDFGSYVGAYESCAPPDGSKQVPAPPDHAAQKWDGSKWLERVKDWKELRNEAYLAKGWVTPYDVIDDAVIRGWSAITADRQAIKKQFPKTQEKP